MPRVRAPTHMVMHPGTKETTVPAEYGHVGDNLQGTGAALVVTARNTQDN